MMLSLGKAETCFNEDQSTLLPLNEEETASLRTVLANQLVGDNADVLAEAAHDAASDTPRRDVKLLAVDEEASDAKAEGSFAMERGSAGQAVAQILSRA